MIEKLHQIVERFLHYLITENIIDEEKKDDIAKKVFKQPGKSFTDFSSQKHTNIRLRIDNNSQFTEVWVPNPKDKLLSNKNSFLLSKTSKDDKGPTSSTSPQGGSSKDSLSTPSIVQNEKLCNSIEDYKGLADIVFSIDYFSIGDHETLRFSLFMYISKQCLIN